MSLECGWGAGGDECWKYGQSCAYIRTMGGLRTGVKGLWMRNSDEATSDTAGSLARGVAGSPTGLSGRDDLLRWG